ncbi:hypothetical protein LTR91_014372 [Friedmanniomyces endolithicus]|uniref:F-box domain-containing protein n=1 Tax=Friedmanniomyces endolithicus TaxID=329885 RepID=A0AAN6KC25_9PEZI|nr:hypothetical protein LTR94_007237 [Friedmanniomyces endolithicus]KAK0811712.1 hypothetical protein LTR75_005168 [Friedmanniomyces endolithicus]KAK0868050.1 hypothetical protein LTS02_003806 [Friedmanniomyces endolithicus]KAK0875010.1 hypothetical protein LTR87_011189 [Friedmanniomyces endolithicus]KAK0908542.1 hypothetical protein LTR02_004884 [Friedmanniomyces endolithicus]
MAAERVFGISELRDNILRNLDERTLLLSQSVNRAFASSIAESSEFQRQLFFFAEEASPNASFSDITVNPLIGKLLTNDHLDHNPFEETMETIQVELSSTFLEPPNADNKTYRLKHTSGSWQRMYLVRPARHMDVIVSCEGSVLGGSSARQSFTTALCRDAPQRPLLSLMASEPVQHLIRAAGILTYVEALAALLRAGLLAPAVLADCEAWVPAPKGKEAQRVWKLKSLRLLVSAIGEGARQGASEYSLTKARKYSFLCAIEELEGREGPRYQESNEVVQRIRSEPGLLAIDGKYQRLVRWSFICHAQRCARGWDLSSFAEGCR